MVINLQSSMRRLSVRSGLLALASVLLLALPSDAQNEPRGPSLRLFTGLGITSASDLRIRQPSLGTDLTFQQVAWEHNSLSTEWTRDSIPYVGARAEFFFREPSWLGAPVEVLNFKIFAPGASPSGSVGLISTCRWRRRNLGGL